jgi:NDP-sugar pyrophosphorylase family protein
MAKASVVVLAAGIGSRYGGLKQIEPVGPGGETIIDYSIYDAIRSGFGKVVFVIRRDIEEAFREAIGRRFEDKVEVRYAFQELDMVPAGFTVPADRKKPWGTGHAVLCALEEVSEPFAVINGDDYYGHRSFQTLGEYLLSRDSPEQGAEEYVMAGFVLRQTLSEFGHVARGVCSMGADGFLERVVERTHIEQEGNTAKFVDEAGKQHPLTGDEIVSMNLWGFTPSLFDHLRAGFEQFLRANGGNAKAEFFLPFLVNELIARGEVRVRVLPTPDSWFGVTYREDKARVDKSVRELIAKGVYPEKLWE